MKTQIATPLTDALVATGHPRLDFRTEEGSRVVSFLAPVLEAHASDGKRLLDLGCGVGKTTFQAEAAGATVTGIDCAETAIAFARNVAEAMESSAQFDIGDFTDMPYEDDSFDVVLFPNNISECSYGEVSAIMVEAARVLVPGGIFILTMRDEVRAMYERGIAAGECPWELESGKKDGTITIPEVGSFSYPTYFWTCAFAVHVARPYFDLHETMELDKGRTALVLRSVESR